ncbi:MAG: metal-dependent transcriptional regulator [Oscillospiraceae bacterium]|nr:metal-dependent transcriptional regulator [Oscillospiraceae bacterium]
MKDGRRSSEDYLEAILMIREKKGSCRSVDVAAHLGFSKPSVSVAMNKLEESGCVERLEDGQLRLTEKGLAIARNTLDKHHLLTEVFCAMGVGAETAEHDACLIEHSLSEETYEKLRLFWDRHKK